jgi:hypothetical protein
VPRRRPNQLERPRTTQTLAAALNLRRLLNLGLAASHETWTLNPA